MPGPAGWCSPVSTVAWRDSVTCGTGPATQAYAKRRTAEGKTPREIKRCLKRYLARDLYRLLENPTQPT